MNTPAWYILDGINPVPWTSPEASVGYRSGGHYVQMHKTESLRAFQEAVADLFTEQNPGYEKWEGEFLLEFFLWRRLDEYEVEDGKKSRDHRADATNMQKALEDSLQKILYDNDRDCVDIHTRIMEQGPDVEPRILIHICPPKPLSGWLPRMASWLATKVPKVEKKSNILPAQDLF
jgi:Holliday junction resolvase RusA-like endonuclease